MAIIDMKGTAGYSVLELLIAVVLISIIAVTGTGLLFTSLGSSGKASSLTMIKQSGDHAVGIIERFIRESESVGCPATDSLETIDRFVDGTEAKRLIQINASDYLSYTDGVNESLLTGEGITASAFTCTYTAGAFEAPDIVEIRFTLSLALGNRPSEAVTENFGTRVSLRTY